MEARTPIFDVQGRHNPIILYPHILLKYTQSAMLATTQRSSASEADGLPGFPNRRLYILLKFLHFNLLFGGATGN